MGEERYVGIQVKNITQSIMEQSLLLTYLAVQDYRKRISRDFFGKSVRAFWPKAVQFAELVCCPR
jgi:hypothetical protein